MRQSVGVLKDTLDRLLQHYLCPLSKISDHVAETDRCVLLESKGETSTLTPPLQIPYRSLPTGSTGILDYFKVLGL
jgi:hypothetical protein